MSIVAIMSFAVIDRSGTTYSHELSGHWTGSVTQDRGPVGRMKPGLRVYIPFHARVMYTV
jgi:hypothetical protein